MTLHRCSHDQNTKRGDYFTEHWNIVILASKKKKKKKLKTDERNWVMENKEQRAGSDEYTASSYKCGVKGTTYS